MNNKKIKYNGRDYLIDPVNIKSGGWNEFYHAKDKLNIFYKKKVNYDAYFVMTGDISDVLKKQPTKEQVDKAIIWGAGYDGENSIYSIKSGGETAGDYYMSVLRYDTTGTWGGPVVNEPILIKYSTNFEDVLITLDEFRGLFELSCSKKDTKEMKRDDVIAAVNYYYWHAKTDEDKQLCINQIVDSNLKFGIEFVAQCRNDKYLEKSKELLNILRFL